MVQVEIIPAFRLPRDKVSFTYSVPEAFLGNLSIGQIVEIPWRKGTKQGVIVKIHLSTVYDGAKELIQPLEDSPSFSKEKVSALQQIASHYFCAPSTILTGILPEKPKRKRDVEVQKLHTFIPSLQVHPSAIKQVEKICSVQTSQTIRYKTESERLFLYRQLVAHHKRVVIICPTYLDAEQVTVYLQKYFPEKVALWDNKQGKNQLWELWNNIKLGDIEVVIGTVSATFVPIKEPLYILDQDGRQEHKQFEGSPYLDARRVVSLLAQATSSPLIKAGFVPQVDETTTHSCSERSFFQMTTKHREVKSLFVPDIEDYLRSDVSRILLVMPSFGAASALYCLDCQTTWRCPDCATKLRVEKDRLSCMICQRQFQIPTQCSQCYGYRIKLIGVGIDGMKQALEQQYKRKVDVFTAGIKKRESDALVTILTPYQLKRLAIQEQIPDNAMVILYHPEQLLYSPDYNGQFNFYHFLQWHRATTEAYCKNAHLLLQTDLPVGHHLLQQVLVDAYQDFIQEELTQRKRFQYPPYSDFIAINTNTPISPFPGLLGPFKAQKSHYRYVLKSNSPHAQNLDKTLGSFYNKVKIDRNPDRLLFIPQETHA